MPRSLRLSLVVLGALSLLPFACIYKSRGMLSPRPRVHLLSDMDNQPRFKSQQENPLFADGRAMRPPVAGTVARGHLMEDDRLALGMADGRWTTTFPMPLSETLLRRGHERFDVYCSPCHGLAGYGDGMVAERAGRLQEGTWVPPSSLHDETVRARDVGHLFNTLTNGIRTMPAYGSQIPVVDRWAIVAYVRALQRSQHASMADVPPDLRTKLR